MISDTGLEDASLQGKHEMLKRLGPFWVLPGLRALRRGRYNRSRSGDFC